MLEEGRELWEWLHFSPSLAVLASPTPALPVPAAPMPSRLQERGAGPRSSPYFFNEGNKCFPVGHPLTLQVLLGGEFIAAQLQGNLKAVGVEVIEVLHTWKRRASGQGNARTLHPHVPALLPELPLTPILPQDVLPALHPVGSGAALPYLC